MNSESLSDLGFQGQKDSFVDFRDTSFYNSCFDYYLTLVKSKPTVYLVFVVYVHQVSDLVPQKCLCQK
jgi:hypothetical protein